MKILRIFIKGPHIRFADMPVPDTSTMANWTKALEQNGCIVGETFMVPRESVECMAIFEGEAPSATVMPFTPKPVA